MSWEHDPIPDVLLEQFALGELSGPLQARLTQRLASDPQLAARLAALQEDDARTLERLPPDQVLAEVRRRQAQAAGQAALSPSRGRPGWLKLAPALALPLLVLALVRFPGGTPDNPADPAMVRDTVRLKGLTPRLDAFVSRQGKVEALTDQALVQPGERIQLRYGAAGQAYGTILSLDARGAITLHHPAQPGGSTALVQEGPVALESSFELDETPGFERFFFITSMFPIDLPTVEAAARDLARHPDQAARGPLSLAPGLTQHTLTLVKAPVAPQTPR